MPSPQPRLRKANRDLVTKYSTTGDSKARLKVLGDIQRQLATDSVNAYMFQLPQFAVGRKKPTSSAW